MRTKEEIHKNFLPHSRDYYALRDFERFAVLMEVLLDIRELLIKKGKI